MRWWKRLVGNSSRRLKSKLVKQPSRFEKRLKALQTLFWTPLSHIVNYSALNHDLLVSLRKFRRLRPTRAFSKHPDPVKHH